MPNSIFSDEWRECLVAHYSTIARAGDQRTERTLRGVMLDVGFTEDDLRSIYLSATAHVDQVEDGFSPDVHFVAAVTAPAPEIVTEIAPDPLPDQPPYDLAELADEADESQELLALSEPESLDEAGVEDDLPADAPEDEPPPPADPDITQLTLF